MQPLTAFTIQTAECIHYSPAYRIQQCLDLLVDIGLVVPPHPVPPVDGGLGELQPVSGAKFYVRPVNQPCRVESFALVVCQNRKSGFLCGMMWFQYDI